MSRPNKEGLSTPIAARESTSKHLLDELLSGELSKHVENARVLCHIVLNLQRCKACNTITSTSLH